MPSYVYVTTSNCGRRERLITSLVLRLKSMQLYMMCECKRNIHAVKRQKDIALHLENKTLCEAHPYVIWGLRIITMLIKLSAYLVASLGSMVFDLDKSLLKGIASIITNMSLDVLEKEGMASQEINLLKLKSLPIEFESRIAHH